MKVYKEEKLIAESVNNCTGWRSAVGLRFKKSFEPFDAYLIHMLADSVLDTFFVPFSFTAVWLSEDYEVLKVETCEPWRFYKPVQGQKYVLELAVEKKGLIKKGDELNLQILK